MTLMIIGRSLCKDLGDVLFCFFVFVCLFFFEGRGGGGGGFISSILWC